MSSLSTIVRATQASARAVSSMSRWRFVMNDCERTGMRGTPAYQQASLNFYRAQQRYRNAQKLLRLNPLPGDNK
jgi:hypothetical protein